MSCSKRSRRSPPHGVALVDVLLSIVLLGIAAATMTTTASRLSAQSADTLTSHQAHLFANGLLETVRERPSAYCVLATGACNLASLVTVPPLPASPCTATGRVVPQALAGIAALDGSGQPQVLRVIVTVSCPGTAPIVVDGFRVRYATGAF